MNNESPKPAPRDRIFQTAVRLFAKHGFAGTGMRELANKADVNLAMINYFYGSKKGLLKEILDDFFVGYIALNPNFRTTLLSGICIPKLVLKEDANERKKKGTFGQV